MVVAPWPTTFKGVVLGGIIVGLLAGAVMALFTMIYAASTGIGFLTPLRDMSAIFYGPEVRGIVPVIIGALLHFTASLIFGLIFAAFLRYSTVLVAAMAGVAYALFIWLTMSYVMLPLFNRVLSQTMRGGMPFGWFFAHAFFGVTLGAAPVLVSRYSKPARFPAADQDKSIRQREHQKVA